MNRKDGGLKNFDETLERSRKHSSLAMSINENYNAIVKNSVDEIPSTFKEPLQRKKVFHIWH